MNNECMCKSDTQLHLITYIWGPNIQGTYFLRIYLVTCLEEEFHCTIAMYAGCQLLPINKHKWKIIHISMYVLEKKIKQKNQCPSLSPNQWPLTFMLLDAFFLLPVVLLVCLSLIEEFLSMGCKLWFDIIVLEYSYND